MPQTLAGRRWANFRANRRAFYALWLFLGLFGLSLAAELLANDKPLLVRFQGETYAPFLRFYPETAFGGDFETEADYTAPEVRCLILAGGDEGCFDDPEALIAAAARGDVAAPGWILSAPIPFDFRTIDYDLGKPAPSPPDGRHWLGTDDQQRDVLARVIYGFRISVFFAITVTVFASLLGIAAGAVQGYLGGRVDLLFQRFIEIWESLPALIVIIIIAAVLPMNFALLTLLVVLFSWTALVSVVRAEFLRARNFEYVRAARAMGVSDVTIMIRHVLPNAMVATLTLLPFIVTGAVGWLSTLDFLGFGLPPTYPSLGELALQGKNNVTSPHLGLTAFFTFAVMLSLLVFIFEGVRDAFDPRKTFA